MQQSVLAPIGSTVPETLLQASHTPWTALPFSVKTGFSTTVQ